MTLGSNLALRLSAVMLAGFVVMQLAILLLIPVPETGAPKWPLNLPNPEQTATLVAAVERTPPADRQRLVGALDTGLYSLRWTPRLAAVGDQDRPRLRRVYAAALPGHDVVLQARGGPLRRLALGWRGPGRFAASAKLAVSLNGGGALLFEAKPSPSLSRYLKRRSFLGALSGGVVVVMLALAVRQSTRPIVRLAAGVRHFSRDLSAPDLPIEGPSETRELARAYNEMKARIAGLMEERTRILAGIAHDLRTYLTRLRLRAEFIEPERQRERAARDLEEMAALLDDTLLFAGRGKGSGEPEPIALAAFVEEEARRRRDVGEAVTLAAAPEEPCLVLARPMAIRRMLANLVDNGLRYGSRVEIEVQAGDTIRLVVRDDGPGVAAAELAKLGQAFGRLEPSRDREQGGAGLGLAIVKALAEECGGKLILANGALGGLEAAVELPRA